MRRFGRHGDAIVRWIKRRHEGLREASESRLESVYSVQHRRRIDSTQLQYKNAIKKIIVTRDRILMLRSILFQRWYFHLFSSLIFHIQILSIKNIRKRMVRKKCVRSEIRRAALKAKSTKRGERKTQDIFRWRRFPAAVRAQNRWRGPAFGDGRQLFNGIGTGREYGWVG